MIKFKREIIWSILAFILMMLYLAGDEGGKCIAFSIISICISKQLTDFIIGDEDGENFFDCSGDNSVGDGHRFDNE